MLRAGAVVIDLIGGSAHESWAALSVYCALNHLPSPYVAIAAAMTNPTIRPMVAPMPKNRASLLMVPSILKFPKHLSFKTGQQIPRYGKIPVVYCVIDPKQVLPELAKNYLND